MMMMLLFHVHLAVACSVFIVFFVPMDATTERHLVNDRAMRGKRSRPVRDSSAIVLGRETPNTDTTTPTCFKHGFLSFSRRKSYTKLIQQSAILKLDFKLAIVVRQSSQDDV